MMRDALTTFPQQFLFSPVIERKEALPDYSKFVVLGMGGSQLASLLIRAWDPTLDIFVYNDYGLPPLPASVLHQSFIIASSYSGNTEEVLDGFAEALEKGYAVAVVSAGGKLIEGARSRKKPCIMLPSGVQPRVALGYSTRALLALFRRTDGLEETGALAGALDTGAFETKGKALAKDLEGKIPVVYASGKNAALAYNWKIKFNETGKIPAFANVFPELNHNEMAGFDISSKTAALANPFHFVFLTDDDDDVRIAKRMDVTEILFRERKLPVTRVPIFGKSRFEKIFSSLFLADWVSFTLAESYGVDPEKVPLVEEFKKKIAG